ncbi:hypothetical protein NFHSH190041_11900 [Shewanella sp. NFH-SH190041]|uniref:LicD family protein n=1 Tax=Shewanella sp. NFH-SH190041 TaxID=2950245 RepID=UPI0021C4ACC0|nr:LicD family protein [Shewanella sp. NFH-SH190041]BDM63738.1 hypothetical protein NFHSH190041_11900 [Shewanella sp. NFH-SH190041]
MQGSAKQTRLESLAAVGPGQSHPQQYVLFGCGSGGKTALARLQREGVAVTALCDNDASLWGQEYQGLPIMAPAVLLGSETAIASTAVPTLVAGRHIHWLIASGYSPAIVQQLQQAGVSTDAICVLPQHYLKSFNFSYAPARMLAENLLLSCCHYFDRQQLMYWLDFGTLLGLVRDGELIPWDSDLDCAMPKEDFDRLCQQLPKLTAVLSRALGREVTARLIDGQFVAPSRVLLTVTLVEAELNMDIFCRVFPKDKDALPTTIALEDTADTDCEIEIMSRRVPAQAAFFHHAEPLYWRGRRLHIPAGFEPYLSHVYGPDWRVANRNWTLHTQ